MLAEVAVTVAVDTGTAPVREPTMTAMFRSPSTSMTLRHVWLASIGLAGSTARNVRNARDIAGTAVEKLDVVQRRVGRRLSALRRGMWTRL